MSMRSLLVVLVLIAACVVGFGFYRGWFAMSSPSAPAGNNDVNVNLKMDKDKIDQDFQTAKDKAAELTHSATDDSAETDDRVKNNNVTPDVE